MRPTSGNPSRAADIEKHHILVDAVLVPSLLDTAFHKPLRVRLSFCSTLLFQLLCYQIECTWKLHTASIDLSGTISRKSAQRLALPLEQPLI